tara:strand:- start:268 stop:588 length:321 start_codon:yes stop_codon:yes gene_type:complete
VAGKKHPAEKLAGKKAGGKNKLAGTKTVEFGIWEEWVSGMCSLFHLCPCSRKRACGGREPEHSGIKHGAVSVAWNVPTIERRSDTWAAVSVRINVQAVGRSCHRCA